jgi:hypothetical protein
MMPTTGAQLILQDQTITGHYASRICAAAATPELVPNLQKRNSWSQREWQTINLDIYSSIIRRNSHHHINVVKYIHDKPPTATIRQYTDSHITKRCILCHDEIEKCSHVIRCTHPTRHAWRHNLLKIIREYCEGSHTRLDLLQIAVEGLRSWFRGVPLSSDTFPPEFHPLIREQNSIGWFGFLRAFTSKLWTHHQHQHLHHNDLVTKSRNGALWLVNLLSPIWDQVFVLWDLYKATLHGATEVTQNAILSRNLSLRIQALHDRKLEVCLDDRRWFIPNLAYYLSAVAKPQSMRNWLLTYEPIILDGIRLARATTLVNTRSLRTYFPTTVLPRNPRSCASTINPRLHRILAAGTPATRRGRRSRQLPSYPTVLQFFRPTSLIHTIPTVPPIPPIPPPSTHPST